MQRLVTKHKLFSSVSNSNYYVIRYFLKTADLCKTLKENLSRCESKNPATHEIDFFVFCAIT